MHIKTLSNCLYLSSLKSDPSMWGHGLVTREDMVHKLVITDSFVFLHLSDQSNSIMLSWDWVEILFQSVICPLYSPVWSPGLCSSTRRLSFPPISTICSIGLVIYFLYTKPTSTMEIMGSVY